MQYARILGDILDVLHNDSILTHWRIGTDLLQVFFFLACSALVPLSRHGPHTTLWVSRNNDVILISLAILLNNNIICHLFMQMISFHASYQYVI